MEQREMYDKMLESVRKLPEIPENSANEYWSKTDSLIDALNEKMKSISNINDLIGFNPLQIMFDNHKNHVMFMSTVFNLASYELLGKTLPWVYRAYINHKFSDQYFLAELNEWKNVITEILENEHSQEILKVYDWMIEHHNDILALSEFSELEPVENDIEWKQMQEIFQQSLLKGEVQKCKEIAQKFVKSKEDIENFYIKVIQISMTNIGKLWEKGEVSVAQEHLASAVISRIMALLSVTIQYPERSKGKIVVTSAHNEFHQIGAMMISDFFELEGKDVKFLGANTPVEELMKLLNDFKPDVLCFSVTMPFNLLLLKKSIESVKRAEGLENIKILVGGKVFNDNPGLWDKTGADAWAKDIKEADQIINSWIKGV